MNLIATRLGEPTYIGTAFINVTGSLLIGATVEYFAQGTPAPPMAAVHHDRHHGRLSPRTLWERRASGPRCFLANA